MPFWKTRLFSNNSGSVSIIKRLLPHLIIVVAFILICGFVFKPLFLNLEKIQGESALHQIDLPPATHSLTFYLNITEVTEKKIGLDGWVFLKNQDNENSQKFIVLSSEAQTYVFDMVSYNLNQVQQKYAIDGFVLKNVGFTGILPLRNVENGEYMVGFYVQEGENRVCEYTDSMIVKTDEDAFLSISTSRVQAINLPETSTKSSLWIDAMVEKSIEEMDYIQIDGWGFIDGQSTLGNVTYLVLNSGTQRYIFSTFDKDTPWLPAQFSETELELEKAGFTARIPVEMIEFGTYDIGVCIIGYGIESFAYTGKQLVKVPAHFELK